jgi:Ulp1 family protease
VKYLKKNPKLIDVKVLLIPVNIPSPTTPHWKLILVDFTRYSIVYVDSLLGKENSTSSVEAENVKR